MICHDCGTILDPTIKFCPQCGVAVAKAIVPAMNTASAPRTEVSRDLRMMIGWLFLTIACVLLVVLIVRASLSSETGNAPSVLDGSPIASSPADDSVSLPPVAPKPQAPPFSGLTLHPYDLLKNPYQAKGKLVTLNLDTMPILWDGAVVRYSDPMDPTFGVRLGLMALRLERFSQEDTALYDVMGTEAGGSTGQMLGQVAVQLPEGKTELRLDRAWMVEPLDPLQGTNYLGAPIQIPSVRFWRYVGENDESATSQDAKVAPSMGFRYAKYPHGYRVDDLCSRKQRIGKDDLCYPFNWQPWIKELEVNTAGTDAEALEADTGSAGVGNLTISWDSEQRVVFYGFRPHESTSASAYFIVAPTKRELDIVWQRGDAVTYLGPNALLLKKAHAYEWLQQIGF